MEEGYYKVLDKNGVFLIVIEHRNEGVWFMGVEAYTPLDDYLNKLNQNDYTLEIIK